MELQNYHKSNFIPVGSGCFGIPSNGKDVDEHACWFMIYKSSIHYETTVLSSVLTM
jgi:hypothetical protein